MQADRAWKILGAREPYFAVLTDPRFQTADRAGAERDAFFRSGEEDIGRVFGDIRESVCADFAPRRALDFGCGVGRLVLPLATRVSEVVGVDVSPAMLQEAQRNVAERALDNVTLLCSSDQDYRLPGAFDFIHSYIVFQHIPRKLGMTIVQQLLKHLSPGGVGALHFVYAIRRSPFWRAAHWARKTIPLVHPLINVALGHPARRPMMQMNIYPLDDLLTMLRDFGCDRVTIRLTEQDGFLGAMLMFRKH